MSNGNGYSYEDYNVAIITAIDYEMSAFRYMLDREHPRLPTKKGDSNMYVLGELNGHNIVLACLPGNQGKGAAATTALNMARTFPSIEWRFLIGIGGGAPSNKHDIRLGDVVISMPEGSHGGVVQYDLGKATEDDFQLKGFLVPPPTILRNVAQMMKSDHLGRRNRVDEFVSAMMQRTPDLSIFSRPSDKPDILYDAGYRHVSGEATCAKCDSARTVYRSRRRVEGSVIHYGLIASGDRVVKSGTKRDRTTHDVGDILCFEMEAAGVATELPCIVIRGISDYADSHKNDSWHYYAAAVAAGAAKEMISYLDPSPRVPSAGAATSLAGGGSISRSDFRGTGIQHSGSGSFSVGRDMRIGR
ncbi:hypothetical protein TWF281_003179 [Arthrobotrys megalospora]